MAVAKFGTALAPGHLVHRVTARLASTLYDGLRVLSGMAVCAPKELVLILVPDGDVHRRARGMPLGALENTGGSRETLELSLEGILRTCRAACLRVHGARERAQRRGEQLRVERLAADSVCTGVERREYTGSGHVMTLPRVPNERPKEERQRGSCRAHAVRRNGSSSALAAPANVAIARRGQRTKRFGNIEPICFHSTCG
jgi:hypothetical protein